MAPNPFAALLHSRKFWLLILDVVVSMTTYFITKYAAPAAANDILYVIGGLQPVFVTLIGAIAVEDNGQRKLDEAVMYQESADADRAARIAAECPPDA